MVRAAERDVPQHELYCAGHLFQAAVAHHRATGERTLLEVARRLADHIGRVYGPGRRAGTGGHPEIEMALVELYRQTGQRAYLDQAGFVLGQRGQRRPVLTGEPYLQDHAPVREQAEAVDHPDGDVWELALPARAPIIRSDAPSGLSGVVALEAEAVARADDDWRGKLYREADRAAPGWRPARLTAIPYYAWANRAAGSMLVWLSTTEVQA